MVNSQVIRQLKKNISKNQDAYNFFCKVIDRSPDNSKQLSGKNFRLEAAISLANKLGIKTIMIPPSSYFSWDGAVMAVDTDTSVVLHDIAHWQLASPPRRTVPDFGLGASPETGYSLVANNKKCIDNSLIEIEECCASLLGIAWEVYLGLNAKMSLIEQNWLELAERKFTSDLFISTFLKLKDRGLIDSFGNPLIRPITANS
ncbi:MAG: hypothetical protein CBC47_02355 [Alphaproteobacteria bacterium TMED87]|nr:hypothetical protein [Rhodospirillaceae bacterium]OUV10912.1 MAG: hypothetical protein CBC47_02355 [Alphaproteobacteria bacterium TMED87]|tara:strand:- start:242 stop:847 length:606 start_codon:yes stop_codon:yes gene_type:complete